ncbi:hypothetical protein BDZ89DRAFT_756441 [Hymenopellis radicata]|nr:hypothetical protein BDZ89DRAFT_756441 [Hymenopellis radicata]
MEYLRRRYLLQAHTSRERLGTPVAHVPVSLPVFSHRLSSSSAVTSGGVIFGLLPVPSGFTRLLQRDVPRSRRLTEPCIRRSHVNEVIYPWDAVESESRALMSLCAPSIQFLQTVALFYVF